MSAEYDYLSSLRDSLSAVVGVKSVAIGLERGIGAKDSPFIRIVPERISASGMSGRTALFQVVFGVDAKNRDYDHMHERYFSMADEIIGICISHGATWVETVTDQDTVQNLKAGAIIFKAQIC